MRQITRFGSCNVNLQYCELNNRNTFWQWISLDFYEHCWGCYEPTRALLPFKVPLVSTPILPDRMNRKFNDFFIHIISHFNWKMEMGAKSTRNPENILSPISDISLFLSVWRTSANAIFDLLIEKAENVSTLKRTHTWLHDLVRLTRLTTTTGKPLRTTFKLHRSTPIKLFCLTPTPFKGHSVLLYLSFTYTVAWPIHVQTLIKTSYKYPHFIAV